MSLADAGPADDEHGVCRDCLLGLVVRHDVSRDLAMPPRGWMKMEQSLMLRPLSCATDEKHQLGLDRFEVRVAPIDGIQVAPNIQIH